MKKRSIWIWWQKPALNLNFDTNFNNLDHGRQLTKTFAENIATFYYSTLIKTQHNTQSQAMVIKNLIWNLQEFLEFFESPPLPNWLYLHIAWPNWKTPSNRKNIQIFGFRTESLKLPLQIQIMKIGILTFDEWNWRKPLKQMIFNKHLTLTHMLW